ncbi:MAG TPA: lipase [Pseudonocardiaceae bacterium]|nr:lipase [Pseudonocardiaceae bacterium]
MPSALRRLALTATGLAMAAAATVAVTSPASAAVGTLSLLGTTANVPHGWDSVEHWNDTDPQWPATHYLSDGRQNQTGETATLFGSPTPPGSQFLLYRAPGWNTNAGAPVLLVMGANDDVDREYSDPAAGGAGTCGVTACPSTGLMQLLSGEGFRVFAVDFADTQGDNLEWAQTISDALSRVKTETGTTSVDLVSWSKGAFAARMYVAGVAPTWGRPYQGDVHKLVLIGNPNGGLDYTFAHGTEGNPLIYPECGGTLNGPSPSQSYVCFGLLRSEPNLAITSQFFTGQRQMLARWDTTFGVDETQDDWETTYYGGTGFISISKGIQQAINAGSLVATIQATPTPATVPTYLLCGSAPTILGFFNEDRGPSDGVVFDVSCTSTKGIGDVAGNTLITTDNHLMLGWESTAMHTVSGWLSS